MIQFYHNLCHKIVSHVWYVKTVQVSLSFFPLVGASLGVHWLLTEKKHGNHSKIKSQGPCKIELRIIIFC